MKTLYAASLARLGLSHSEAGAIHGLGQNGLSTVKQWASGRRSPPPGVWDDLRAYHDSILDAADDLRAAWDEAGGPLVEISAAQAGGAPLLAAAEFVLGTPPGTPVNEGQSEATRAARRSRRMAGD